MGGDGEVIGGVIGWSVASTSHATESCALLPTWTNLDTCRRSMAVYSHGTSNWKSGDNVMQIGAIRRHIDKSRIPMSCPLHRVDLDMDLARTYAQWRALDAKHCWETDAINCPRYVYRCPTCL